ncbi:hypothetical protein B0H13DRAFT_2277501 [Mycena leptocephala]|nr:hypothetical protein B0H13DRAFT_2277501 [Mycena leptocephala]
MLLGNFQTPDTRRTSSSLSRTRGLEHLFKILGFWGIGSGGQTRVGRNLELLGLSLCRVSTRVLGDQGRNWQVATFVWAVGVQGRNLGLCLSLVGSQARFRLCLLGFWGTKVATWQVATSVWALGDQGCNLAKLQPFFGFWRIGLSCDLASRILFPATLERQ